MNKTFIKTSGLIILSILGITIFITGCLKSNPNLDETLTAPINGVLTGKIIPIGSVYKIRIINAAGKSYYSTPDPSGNFKIENIAPDSYSLRAISTGNYLTDTSSVVIPASKTTDIGTITMTIDPTKSKYITYSVNNLFSSTYLTTFTSGYVDCSYSMPNFYIYVPDLNYELTIYLSNLSGVGTYNDRHIDKVSEFKVFSDYADTTSTWSTVKGGSGKLSVTAIDTLDHRISGTFTATAVPEDNSTTGNRLIKGKFNDLFYK